jgi:hypothetical protein
VEIPSERATLILLNPNQPADKAPQLGAAAFERRFLTGQFRHMLLKTDLEFLLPLL